VCARRAADKAVQVKLMPVAVALDAAGQPTPALLKKLAALGADASAVPQLKRAPDGKAEALFLDTVVPGATLAAGLQKALDEAIAKLPIPKVMQYQLRRRLERREVRAPGARPGGAARRRGGAGDGARPEGRPQTQGHRFEAAVPHPVVRCADADSYARQLARAGRGDRQLRRAPRRDRAPAAAPRRRPRA
jgi:glycyl-tRNA synthetase beta chain